MQIKALLAVGLLAASVALGQSTDIDSIRREAEKGNSTAQFKLGHAYDFGDGVAKDHDQAIVWYQKAASQGNASAQTMIGYCYEIGYGLPQDFVQAAAWFRKAAEKGSAVAEAWLGYSYGAGKGLPQNDALAVSWYRKAADQGDSLGQALLGGAYLSGLGVPRDYVESYFWTNLALAGDLDGFDSTREQAEKTRKAAAEHLTAEQIAEVQQRATRWFEDRKHGGDAK